MPCAYGSYRVANKTSYAELSEQRINCCSYNTFATAIFAKNCEALRKSSRNTNENFSQKFPFAGNPTENFNVHELSKHVLVKHDKTFPLIDKP